MLEIHVYRGQPEPGFREEIQRIIEEYSAVLPGSATPSFIINNVYDDCPSLRKNPEFVAAIFDVRRYMDYQNGKRNTNRPQHSPR